MATDKMVLRAARRVPDRPISTADFHYLLGQEIREIASAPEKSLVAAAAECDVPIYTSSPGDSSIGMNLILPHLYRRPMQIDFIRDIIETAAIVRDADKNGVIHVGGGSPKNFYLQTQPTLHQILMDESKGGHDYFIQITTDAPHWGGLSGATPQEARSWGKIKDATVNNVVVYACSSLALPLLAQYARIRNKPRPLKRLYQRMPELVETVRRSAAKSPRVAESLKRYFDVPLGAGASGRNGSRKAAGKKSTGKSSKAKRGRQQADTASAAVRVRKAKGKATNATVDRRR
jgi:deoxyhypusine synthase